MNSIRPYYSYFEHCYGKDTGGDTTVNFYYKGDLYQGINKRWIESSKVNGVYDSWNKAVTDTNLSQFNFDYDKISFVTQEEIDDDSSI